MLKALTTVVMFNLFDYQNYKPNILFGNVLILLHNCVVVNGHISSEIHLKKM